LINFAGMENLATSSYEPHGELTVSPETAIVYPPKFQKQEQPANIWLRSIGSLALYLVLGYYVFPSYVILLLITVIVVLHELGHFMAMKAFRYKDLGIFFIPLLGAYVSGTKREVSQQQSAIILLAGPLPGIIIGVVFYLLNQANPGQYLFNNYYLSYEMVGRWFIFLNLLNLLPIYPLDGGQLLNRVFLDEEGWIGKIFVFVSAAFICWLAWKMNMYVLLVLPALMLLRLKADKKFTAVEKRIETEGINMDTSYEELPDADYWKTRNILVTEHPSFNDIPLAPPYEYHPKEEKIMTTIQSLLHRHLIQDISIAGKLFIVLVWVAAFATPWLINMDVSFLLSRFGF
jgi:stage IV sporulation protein FB